MTTRTVTASTANAPARSPATVRAGDPARLTRAELDVTTGGGGPVGVNPSRNGLWLTA